MPRVRVRAVHRNRRGLRKIVKVTCETAAAISLHVREVSDRPVNLTGHVTPRPRALCGAEVWWDRKLGPEHATCRDCRRLVDGADRLLRRMGP